MNYSTGIPAERRIQTAPARTKVLARRRPSELYAAMVLVVFVHGGLLFSGSHKRTYDAYVHLFFADHYRRSWFSTWEPRWYTGFTTASYPPGSHQLLAIVGKLVGLSNAFPLVALASMLLLVSGGFRFCRIFVSQRAAGYAAIALALSSAIAEALHVFGQLPTLLSLGFLLHSLPFAYQWIRSGDRFAFLGGVTCSAATTAIHHVTTLFGVVFFIAPVAAHALLGAMRSPLADEPVRPSLRIDRVTRWPLLARNGRRMLPQLGRSLAYFGSVATALVVVVLPYWIWSITDPIRQVPIPHGSRDNFFVNTNAGILFFLLPWGVLLVVLPYLIVRGLLGRRWPLAASVLLLTVLGLGGTTPIPKLLLGGAYEVLTLDRFGLWGTVAILPFFGELVESAVHDSVRDRLARRMGPRLAQAAKGLFGLIAVGLVLFAATLPTYRPFQPKEVDPGPIVSFLNNDSHDRWRYLTLGFGDQMAWISAQTTAETVDGNYHSARRLPELTGAAVERLEGAKYSGSGGVGSLEQFVGFPEKYHLKFIFSKDHFYDPLLVTAGWKALEPLENGVSLWIHDDISQLPAGRMRQELPTWQRLLWGILPIGVILLAIAFLGAAMSPRIANRYTRSKTKLRVGSRWQKLDEALLRYHARLPLASNGPLRRPAQQVLRKQVKSVTSVLGRVRYVGRITIAMILGLSVVVALPTSTSPLSPGQVVEKYYRALDQRRLNDAYALLDPRDRPLLEIFRAQQAASNGLVASYANLTKVQVNKSEITGGHATISSKLTYLTSLNQYVLPVNTELRLDNARWVVRPEPFDMTIPPEQLVARSSVSFLSQGKRQITKEPAAYQDIADRPSLALPSANLVRRDGVLYVVGEVTNRSAVPAAVTVTAKFMGPKQTVMAAMSANVNAMHTALPGETVPFRITMDQSASDGAQVNVAEIREVQVSAKALLATTEVERDVVIQDVRRGKGATYSAVLRNDSLRESTIPHVFVTLRAANGTVGWVDDYVPPVGLRAQRKGPISLPITPRQSVEILPIRMRTFAGFSAIKLPKRPSMFRSFVGWSTADINVTSFSRLVG